MDLGKYQSYGTERGKQRSPLFPTCFANGWGDLRTYVPDATEPLPASRKERKAQRRAATRGASLTPQSGMPPLGAVASTPRASSAPPRGDRVSTAW